MTPISNTTRTFNPMRDLKLSRLLISSCLLIIVIINSISCFSNYNFNSNDKLYRRSAGNTNNNQAGEIIIGKFKAPAPDRIFRTRIAKNNNFGEQTMSASYRIGENSDNLPEKIVHGVSGSSIEQQQVNKNNQRIVSAKIQVSDEGLNYPPSKLSADIYGNVAEIVTAPPEAVDSDFLVPQVSKLFGVRRGN